MYEKYIEWNLRDMNIAFKPKKLSLADVKRRKSNEVFFIKLKYMFTKRKALDLFQFTAK